MRLARAVGRLSTALGAVAMAQALILTAIMVYEVVCRFGFNAPNIWTYDIASMMAGTLFFLGAGFALREGAHVRIDFLSHRFAPGLAFAIETGFSLLLLLPVLGFMTWSTAGKAWQAFVDGQTDYTSPWAPLMWPFYAAIAVGLGGLWLQAVAELIERIERRRDRLSTGGQL